MGSNVSFAKTKHSTSTSTKKSKAKNSKGSKLSKKLTSKKDHKKKQSKNKSRIKGKKKSKGPDLKALTTQSPDSEFAETPTNGINSIENKTEL